VARPGGHILIVEDERVVAQDISEVLVGLGYTVVGMAASSDEALALATAATPDLILMDIALRDGEDGVAAATKLRAKLDVPVVFVSARLDPNTMERALATLPGGFVRKPFHVPALHTAIEGALRRHRFHVEARTRLAELRARIERLQGDVIHDGLTGLYSRQHLDETLLRVGHPTSLILLDLDRFKTINDHVGQVAADQVLRSVADLLRARLRSYDVPCRVGGDEIAVVVPGAMLIDGVRLAERLRADISALAVADAGRPLHVMTASFGVAVAPEHGTQAASLLNAATAALHQAKAEGRNRVVPAPLPPPPRT
jgi:diguanylate cyclase (GGDEF)-like protein